MLTKDFATRVKAAGAADGLEDGQFTAVVSAFGNTDSVGDKVMPGAFADDLKMWEDSGDPIPVVWSHDWADPFSHIGFVTKATETDEGLTVTGQLDMDNPKAEQVYKLLKGRRVKQFSFAYDIEDSGWATEGDEDIMELRKLKVYEVGPCLVGANQDTELLAVKAQHLAQAAKAGRKLSQSNYDRLAAARDDISAVLDDVKPEDEPDDDEDEDDDEASKTSAPDGAGTETDKPSQVDGAPAMDEELSRAKSTAEEPVSAPRRALAVARITTL